MDIIDLTAPIISGKGAGGLEVEQSLSEFRTWLLQSSIQNSTKIFESKLFHGIYALYSFYNGAIEIIVDITCGDIIRIGCSHGYLGETQNKIRVGLDLKEVLKLDPELVKWNNFLQSKRYKGLLIEVPGEYDDFDYINELPNFLIERISVVPIHSVSVLN